jgi:hypothetical protein
MMPRKTPRTGGGRDKYTEEIAEIILKRIACGEGLNTVCQSDPRLPHETTVRSWVLDDHNGFAARFHRAREMGFDSVAEQIISIGDASIMHNGNPDNALVQHARLMSDNRKWLLSKLVPRKYGDKVTQEITGNPDMPLVTKIELVPVEPVLRAIAAPTIEEDEAPSSISDGG